jgi:hypothetical protein
MSDEMMPSHTKIMIADTEIISLVDLLSSVTAAGHKHPAHE